MARSWQNVTNGESLRLSEGEFGCVHQLIIDKLQLAVSHSDAAQANFAISILFSLCGHCRRHQQPFDLVLIIALKSG